MTTMEIHINLEQGNISFYDAEPNSKVELWWT